MSGDAAAECTEEGGDLVTAERGSMSGEKAGFMALTLVGVEKGLVGDAAAADEVAAAGDMKAVCICCICISCI